MASDSLKSLKENVLKEQIDQRYAEGIREWLKRNLIPFTQKQQLDLQENESTIFEIQLSEPILSNECKYYFDLLKNFYEIRKFISPELSFESFLTQYKHMINQKIQKYQFQGIIDSQVASPNLNYLMASNESVLMKNSTISMILEKKNEIQELEKQSEEVNTKYKKMVKNFIQKNAELNVENIEHQLKLKEHQLSKKQKATKLYLPSQSMKNKAQTKEQRHYEPQKSSINNEKKQQVERIKVIVNNNMWGWGDKIHDRLIKLKSLQEQLFKG